MATIEKIEVTNIEDAEKSEPSYPAGRTVKQYTLLKKEFINSSKSQIQSFLMTQKFHS